MTENFHKLNRNISEIWHNYAKYVVETDFNPEREYSDDDFAIGVKRLLVKDLNSSKLNEAISIVPTLLSDDLEEKEVNLFKCVIHDFF